MSSSPPSPSSHPWPAAVLFDFDGVIVNSEPLHFWAFHEVLRSEKIDITESEYYQELIGFDDKGAFKHVFNKHGRELDPKTFLRVMTTKSEKMMDLIRARKYSALPGVEEFIRALWWDTPLAICSGALREEIEAMLEGISLRDCFKVIVAAEDVTVGKPDPSGYLMCAQQLGQKVKRELKPADCLIVEDAPTVIRSVRNVGFPVLGVAASYPPEKLSDANYVVKDLRPATITAAIPNLHLRQ
jgi:beta-phosphoglucomutase